LFLARRRGGRRYLSEDLAALGVLAAEAAIHIEQFREAEMRRLISQAELRALESQIHPHFLFNALNALYGVIPREAAGARRMVLNLADIFRYFLRSERTYIPLAEELAIVRAYLEIEALRLGPRLRTEIEVSPDVLPELIPVLSIEPLVENAVKHGVAAKAEGGLVRVEAWRDGDALRVRVSDTGNGFQGSGEQMLTKGHGAGLDNVVRRLKLCYGPEADIKIHSSQSGAVVEFQAPLRKAQEAVR
jgi:LytS/YehU family sensor histidine kinase